MNLRTRGILFAAALAAGCASVPSGTPRNDLVAVLPEEGGKVGAVVVHYAGGERVLNTAYAGARIRGTGKVDGATLDPAEVSKLFGPALAALPSKPVSFVVYFLEGSD